MYCINMKEFFECIYIYLFLQVFYLYIYFTYII